jgi:4-aminobutyrate aminotransferase-like enzyme
MMAMELASEAGAVVDAARQRGLLLLLAGSRDVIRIMVPLVVSDDELEEGLQILRASMQHVFTR